MLYELRIYDAIAGKLPAVNARFRDHTSKLFEKHGIKSVGYWTVVIGPSNQRLYYILEWQNMADREQKWNAFTSDPEWVAVRTETEKDGQIVANVEAVFMAATDYSPMK